MGYVIDFEGAATAEIAQLLHAVQAQINSHGILAQAATESSVGQPASGTASGSGGCIPGQTCPDSNHGGHNIVIAVVGLAVGLVVGYMAGKRSKP